MSLFLNYYLLSLAPVYLNALSSMFRSSFLNQSPKRDEHQDSWNRLLSVSPDSFYLGDAQPLGFQTRESWVEVHDLKEKINQLLFSIRNTYSSQLSEAESSELQSLLSIHHLNFTIESTRLIKSLACQSKIPISYLTQLLKLDQLLEFGNEDWMKKQTYVLEFYLAGISDKSFVRATPLTACDIDRIFKLYIFNYSVQPPLKTLLLQILWKYNADGKSKELESFRSLVRHLTNFSATRDRYINSLPLFESFSNSLRASVESKIVKILVECESSISGPSFDPRQSLKVLRGLFSEFQVIAPIAFSNIFIQLLDGGLSSKNSETFLRYMERTIVEGSEIYNPSFLKLLDYCFRIFNLTEETRILEYLNRIYQATKNRSTRFSSFSECLEGPYNNSFNYKEVLLRHLDLLPYHLLDHDGRNRKALIDSLGLFVTKFRYIPRCFFTPIKETLLDYKGQGAGLDILISAIEKTITVGSFRIVDMLVEEDGQKHVREIVEHLCLSLFEVLETGDSIRQEYTKTLVALLTRKDPYRSLIDVFTSKKLALEMTLEQIESLSAWCLENENVSAFSQNIAQVLIRSVAKTLVSKSYFDRKEFLEDLQESLFDIIWYSMEDGLPDMVKSEEVDLVLGYIYLSTVFFSELSSPAVERILESVRARLISASSKEKCSEDNLVGFIKSGSSEPPFRQLLVYRFIFLFAWGNLEHFQLENISFKTFGYMFTQLFTFVSSGIRYGKTLSAFLSHTFQGTVSQKLFSSELNKAIEFCEYLVAIQSLENISYDSLSRLLRATSFISLDSLESVDPISTSLDCCLLEAQIKDMKAAVGSESENCLMELVYAHKSMYPFIKWCLENIDSLPLLSFNLVFEELFFVLEAGLSQRKVKVEYLVQSLGRLGDNVLEYCLRNVFLELGKKFCWESYLGFLLIHSGTSMKTFMEQISEQDALAAKKKLANSVSSLDFMLKEFQPSPIYLSFIKNTNPTPETLDEFLLSLSMLFFYRIVDPLQSLGSWQSYKEYSTLSQDPLQIQKKQNDHAFKLSQKGDLEIITEFLEKNSGINTYTYSSLEKKIALLKECIEVWREVHITIEKNSYFAKLSPITKLYKLEVTVLSLTVAEVFTKDSEDVKKLVGCCDRLKRVGEYADLGAAVYHFESYNKKTLRTNQLLSLVLFCDRTLDKESRGVLQEIKTGEGKSVVIAVLAAYLALKGKKVDVVTSNRDLAARDALANYQFFDYLSLKANTNVDVSVKDKEKMESIYSSDVVYGTLISFQNHYSLKELLLRDLGRKKEDLHFAIVDEVDNFLLDKNNEQFIVSSTSKEMDRLDMVFILIWNNLKTLRQKLWTTDKGTFFLVNHKINGKKEFVCVPSSKEKEKDECAFKIEKVDDEVSFLMEYVKKAVEPWIRELSSEESFEESDMMSAEEDIIGLERLTLKDKTIANRNKELSDLEKYSELSEEMKEKKCKEIWNKYPLTYAEKATNSLGEELKKCAWVQNRRKPRLFLTKEQREFASRKLEDWIRSAIKVDKEFKNGMQYIVKRETDVVLVDYKNTGSLMPNNSFSDGVNQFIYLKEGLPPRRLNFTHSFVSTFGYFKKYSEKIFGVTGTLGSEHDVSFINNTYSIASLKVPHFFNKKYNNQTSPKGVFEYPAILLKTQRAWIRTVAQMNAIIVESGRSTLILCENIKRVRELSETFDKYFPNIHPLIYDGITGLYSDLIGPRTLIIGTNIAGRGTDLKPNEDLEKNGGLHVCYSYFPSNLRVETQGFGRTGRSQFRGTIQYIVKSKKRTLEQLRERRDRREREDSFINERIALGCAFKDDIMEKTTKFFSGIIEGKSEKEKSILKISLFEQWGAFLENHKTSNLLLSQKGNQDTFLQSYEDFKKQIAGKNNIDFEDSNFLLYKGTVEFANERFDNAAKNFKKVISSDISCSLSAQLWMARVEVSKTFKNSPGFLGDLFHMSRLSHEGRRELINAIRYLKKANFVLSYYYMLEVTTKQSWFPHKDKNASSTEIDKDKNASSTDIEKYSYFNMKVYVLNYIKANILNTIDYLEDTLHQGEDL